MVLPSPDARAWWRALMENVVSLVEDAHTLASIDSHARARSLIVLGMEELGKAHRLYDLAERGWTVGADTVEIPSGYLEWAKRHPSKLIEAINFSEYLPHFWGRWIADPIDGDLERWFERRRGRQEGEAETLNLAKQAGFYVDRDEKGQLRSPASDPVSSEDVGAALERLAGATEMLLITDHSRMKFESTVGYDSTHDLQSRLLPYSHPSEFH